MEQTFVRNLRILFVSDHLGYAEGVIHGATTYFLNVLPALRRAGMQMTVVFLRARHPMAERLEAEGITPIFLDRGKWDFRAFGDLARLIRDRDINLVHAAGMKGILLGRLAARSTGAKFLAHLHDTNPLDPLTKGLQRLGAGWTDGCLGISQAVCAYATETMGIRPSRVRLLHSGLPLERYAPTDETERAAVCAEWSIDANDKVVAMIGRLSEEKGHAPFLRGIAPWLKAQSRTRLMIIGGGSLEMPLKELARELGLKDHVIFTGHRDDVPSLLSLVDVLVMPSVREGLGYAALEAMAAGCAVAAFAVGGLPDIVQDETTGLLSPPGDVPHLVRQIERLLTDDALRLRLRENGLGHVREFSVETHVQALMGIYESLLADTFVRGA